MQTTTTMDIQLFLAHADNQRALLQEGLELRETLDAPKPDDTSIETPRLANLYAPADSLADQRYAIVAPKGPEGDRYIELIAPLRRRREEEQGQEAIIYRVDPGMNAVATAAWLQNEYRDRVQRQESARPRYLLLLGGPEFISWEMQQLLGGETFTGRLAFDEESGYEAYVEKALRWANTNNAEGRARALYYAVGDGSRAMIEGNQYLMRPSLEIARKEKEAGKFDAEDIVEIHDDPRTTALDPIQSGSVFLREAARARGGMLFTMSHGAGLPKRGWASAAERRAIQGAMVLDRAGDLLTPNDIDRGPFLPGGVWCLFACYGVGTPSRSVYFPWLQKLQHLGLGGNAERVLAALPKDGESPFVAALPQAALKNPEGPLGVVGHVDLAWSWSFLDYELNKTGFIPKSRAERFQGILRAFVNGHRFGVALHELLRFARSLSIDLTVSYEERTQQSITSKDYVEGLPSKVHRANLWMQRQDLNAYVLLGDPAARLHVTSMPEGMKRRHNQITLDGQEKADAVLAVLRGTASVSTMASRFGVSKEEIERWRAIFLEAGRAALSQIH